MNVLSFICGIISFSLRPNLTFILAGTALISSILYVIAYVTIFLSNLALEGNASLLSSPVRATCVCNLLDSIAPIAPYIPIFKVSSVSSII